MQERSTVICNEEFQSESFLEEPLVQQEMKDSTVQQAGRPGLHHQQSIDDFFSEAHESLTITGLASLLSLFRKRLSFFLCHIALALANIGNVSAVTSVGFLFANESVHEISQGSEGIIASSCHLGALVGGLVDGVLSDSTGRHPVLLVGMSTTSLFGILMIFAQGRSMALPRA